MKLILIIKVMLLLSILIYQGWIRFGERKTQANEAEPKRNEDIVEKSPVDDLLNLPTIDPKTVQKRELEAYLSTIDEQKSILEEKILLLEKRQKNLTSIEKSIEERLKRLQEDMAFFEEAKRKAASARSI